MANEEHLSILKQGVEAWNRWRIDNRYIIPDLSGADLRAADLRAAILRAANFGSTDLRADFIRAANLSAANFGSTDLRADFLRAANLSHANLSHANLSAAFLSGADLSAADLSAANLRAANLRAANLSHAFLSGADLSAADLSHADLSHAVLSHAFLSGATLSHAVLSHATLSHAFLNHATLSHATLYSVNLIEADLSNAVLSNANLRYAVLTDTHIGWTMFCNVDMNEVKGLENVRHLGPSTIGIDTIYRSKGNISYKFLLDAGIPKDDIAYLLSLAGKAIDFYSCFISYSNQDRPFAERLHADLQAKGVRTWYAPEDLKIGEVMLSGIDKGIQLHDKLLVVLSEHSVTSKWVEHEVESALSEELKPERKAKMLFPIRLDNAVMECDVDWAYRIRLTRHIGDFIQWKEHDAYQKAFDRLLRDLKTEVPTNGSGIQTLSNQNR